MLGIERILKVRIVVIKYILVIFKIMGHGSYVTDNQREDSDSTKYLFK